VLQKAGACQIVKRDEWCNWIGGFNSELGGRGHFPLPDCTLSVEFTALADQNFLGATLGEKPSRVLVSTRLRLGGRRLRAAHKFFVMFDLKYPSCLEENRRWAQGKTRLVKQDVRAGLLIEFPFSV
jgi:hypothetical protein